MKKEKQKEDDDIIRIDVAPGFSTRIKRDKIPKYYLIAKIAFSLIITMVALLWVFIISSVLGFDIIPNVHYAGNIFVSLCFLAGSVVLIFLDGWLTFTPYFYFIYARKNYKKYMKGELGNEPQS